MKEIDKLIEKLETLAGPNNISVKFISEELLWDGIWFRIDLEDKIHGYCKCYQIHMHLLAEATIDELADEMVSDAIDYFNSKYQLEIINKYMNLEKRIRR